MEERKYTGEQVFTPNVTEKQIKKAIRNPENQYVGIHKVGSIITMSDGVQYQVQNNGSWKKIMNKNRR